MPPSALRRHGPWIDLRSIGGKDDRFLLVRTEVRSNHLTKSAMYKIVQSTSAILVASRGDEIRRLFGVRFK
jgi:hypothetical protein